MNTMNLIGNLTKDPELRFTPNGQANVTFSLASSRRFKDSNDQWQEKTSFFNCVAWGQMAENIAESLRKGMRVVAIGRMEQRSWETNEGDKRSTVEFNVEEVGPSTRFATIDGVTKNAPNGDSNGNGNGHAPAPAPAMVGAGDEVAEEPF